MAAPTVPRQRRKHIAIKAESTYGTDIFGGSYVAGDILEAEDIQDSLSLEEIENLATSGVMGRGISIIGRETGMVSFRMRARGKGAAYDDSPEVVPLMDRALRACGLGRTFADPGGVAATVTYAPSNTHESFSAYINQENGVCVKLAGCFGTLEVGLRAGAVSDFRFTLMGLIAGVDDVSFVEPTIVQTPLYPTAKSAAFQIGAANYAPRIADVRFALGNVLQPLPSINSAGGLAGYFIADRNPRLSIDPEEATEATFAWYTAWLAATMSDCSFQAGTVQFNRLVYTFPTLQIVNQQRGPRDGLSALNTTLLATNTNGLNDFSISFT